MFLQTISLEQAQNICQENFAAWPLKTMQIDLNSSYNSYLAEDIYAEYDLPPFAKSTVDGYAVRAADTFGASDSIPSILKLAGEIEMGKEPQAAIKPGFCYYIPTGAALPQNCDAVIMLEHCQVYNQKLIGLHKPVSKGQNIIYRGEDVQKSQLLLSKGQKIGLSQIAALSAMGRAKVMVYQPPQVAIISTGDEIRDLSQTLNGAQIYDINSHTISYLATKIGWQVISSQIISDDSSQLTAALTAALAKADMVIMSGGSSAGAKDFGAAAILAQPKGQVLAHGLALKPGKPTIIAKADAKPIIVLPGHPVAAIMVFEELLKPFWAAKIGLNAPSHYLQAVLTENLHAAGGKITYQAVKISEQDGNYLAEPIYGKSGNISLLLNADGYIQMSANCEGLLKGSQVKIKLFD